MGVLRSRTTDLRQLSYEYFVFQSDWENLEERVEKVWTLSQAAPLIGPHVLTPNSDIQKLNKKIIAKSKPSGKTSNWVKN